MISGSIELIVSNKKNKIKLEDCNGTLSINDDFFYYLFNQNNVKYENVDSSQVDLILSSQKDTLEINGVSLFKRVNIKTFTNTTAQFGILSVKDIDLSVSESIIDTFRTSCSSVFIKNSKIDEYEFNIDKKQKCETEENLAQTLELNNVKVNKIAVHRSIEDIIIKDSDIDKLYLNNEANYHLITQNVTVCETTRIDELKINSKIEKLNIQDSKVSRFYFGRIATIHEVNLKNSSIENVFLCSESKIQIKNYDAWKLLLKSAINDNNDGLYAKSGYMINHLVNKNRKGLFRLFSSHFLRLSIGYGYKPSRALGFSVINISFFAFLFLIADYWFEIPQLLNVIQTNDFSTLFKKFMNLYWERWYLSGTAFTTTGFGDVSPSSFGSRILSVIDSLIGVSVLSLFIYSLTKRYGEKK